MVVPYPFSRTVFVYGEPMLIDRHEDVETARQRVEKAMDMLADDAEARFEELWSGA